MVPALCHFLPRLLVLPPGSSRSSGMPFSASHPNQGKHDKNLPWSSPPVRLAHCIPLCQMWVTPRLHPPTPWVPLSSHLVFGVCSPSPHVRLLPWGPPLVSHTRTPADFVAQMREETAGPTVICGSCLLGNCPPALSFSPHGNWGGGVPPSPWDLNEVSPAMGCPTLPTHPEFAKSHS